VHPSDNEPAASDRAELYARLGLTTQASDKDVKTTHKEIVSFLRGAPYGVREWAQREIAEADEALALLSATATAATATARSVPVKPPNPLVKRAAVVAAVATAIAIGIVVYNMGGGQTATGTDQTQAAAQTQSLTPADRARVGQLMEKVQANPKDVSSLIKLGDIFFKAGDYNSAGSWMDKAVAVDPRNVTALLALGAAQFNLNGTADAQRSWLRVVAVDPRNVEAYYDLGFLYLSKKPSDTASARAAWKKVVKLAPNSDVAKTVKTHLKRMTDSSAPPTASGK
jgi:cytochrome c-type biogenesis protein CcmH/NrfG